MKSLAFLEKVEHERKVAIYVAEHDGKTRNFAYHEDFGECRETFARLFQDVQKGEIGVIMTPDTACLSIETSLNWMEALIQIVKQHNILIGDHSHDLQKAGRTHHEAPCAEGGGCGTSRSTYCIQEAVCSSNR